MNFGIFKSTDYIFYNCPNLKQVAWRDAHSSKPNLILISMDGSSLTCLHYALCVVIHLPSCPNDFWLEKKDSHSALCV
ncbi:hypothetical protein PCANC_24451 [Puccinia coronata f. sp. avenae]|uniref:Uncharacterized protein n=1 Tax=Puccinia coronata f. sp. avenae TaxID=200324 RepID=A0A2N5S8S9_9BASI|nr:hypothetical protein PCANC_24451 [Puccinia coronata f. sp. avenae]PLW19233.1 hypothetical protein PCASD_16606 [Puccinia coronata f. sp. avenae]PLW30662.1 hypothetical protein PCASD_15143 [Puccinia coronata f. sp. avenae]